MVYLLTLLLGTLLALAPATARAASSCSRSCRDAATACRRAECTGLAGTRRRECADACRRRLGCGRIGTLAYVVTHCRGQDRRLIGGQELRVRSGDCDEITVFARDTPG